MAAKPELDDVTGVETTGHEWDGLKELNRPLPNWWVWTFWITFIWSIGYWIAMPAWPLLSGYTMGWLGDSSRKNALDAVQAGKDRFKAENDQLAQMDIKNIIADEKLNAFAVNGGKVIFGDNCAPCHGGGAQGGPGFPSLRDNDWIWGGKIDDVIKTVTVGVRSGADGERNNAMPRFGLDKMLTEDQISDVADYVLSLSGTTGDAAKIEKGKVVFADNCVACHGEGGKGNQELGAPNLSDQVWLYGGTREDVVKQINIGRGGVMPSWAGRLDKASLNKVVAYVNSLGGVTK
jgi:cytochrome c oxidase cbb3-type subunit III